MKIVKGKLYSITIDNCTFPLLTTDLERAYTFFTTVFPNYSITRADIKLVEYIFCKSTLIEKFRQIKELWDQMGALQSEPGAIKFSFYMLDLLLENNNLVLTNYR